MGEKQNGPFQVSFNASLKVDFQGSRVTSDGGLILVRELDERLGFRGLMEQPAAAEPSLGGRTPSCLLRTCCGSRCTAAWQDTKTSIPQGGTQRLSQDPTLRLIGSEKIWERGAALTS
jgi:hypothetical protein